MRDKTMWIVVGRTGEYEDCDMWNVAVFADEGEANHFRELCQIEAEKHKGVDGYDMHHPHDPEFHQMGCPAIYYVEPISMKGGVDDER